MCFLDIFKEARDSNKAERQIPVRHCLVSPGDASVGSATWGGVLPQRKRDAPQGLAPPWPSQAIGAWVCLTCPPSQAREGTCRSSGFDLKPGDPIALS